MKRNPYFKEWSKDAMPDGYPDQITQSFGLTVEAQITAIENGQYDWTLEAPPADRLNEMGTKYASQTHVETLTAFWYAPMNVNLPPFTSLKARQAVNYAIDRNALVKIFGGPKLACRPARCCRRASRATSRTARTRRTRARRGRRRTSRRRSSSSTSPARRARRSSSSRRTTRCRRLSASTSRAS